jgi:hypothetical protein
MSTRPSARPINAVVCVECGHRWEPAGGPQGQQIPTCPLCALTAERDEAKRHAAGQHRALTKAEAELTRVAVVSSLDAEWVDRAHQAEAQLATARTTIPPPARKCVCDGEWTVSPVPEICDVYTGEDPGGDNGEGVCANCDHDEACHAGPIPSTRGDPKTGKACETWCGYPCIPMADCTIANGRAWCSFECSRANRPLNPNTGAPPPTGTP